MQPQKEKKNQKVCAFGSIRREREREKGNERERMRRREKEKARKRERRREKVTTSSISSPHSPFSKENRFLSHLSGSRYTTLGGSPDLDPDPERWSLVLRDLGQNVPYTRLRRQKEEEGEERGRTMVSIQRRERKRERERRERERKATWKRDGTPISWRCEWKNTRFCYFFHFCHTLFLPLSLSLFLSLSPLT